MFRSFKVNLFCRLLILIFYFNILILGPSSWWLATHLVDLLFYHDANILAISSKTNHDDLDLRTRIVTEYANTLFATDGLWDIAADYLMASGSENVLQDLNDRMSELDWKKNTQLVERFLVTCDRYDLFTAKTNITRAVTAKFILLLLPMSELNVLL